MKEEDPSNFEKIVGEVLLITGLFDSGIKKLLMFILILKLRALVKRYELYLF